MFNTRHGAMASAILSLLSLFGCSSRANTSEQMALTGAAKPAGLNFSIDTPVERIAANPRGKEILKRDLPGLMSNPSYILFDDMSLSQIATVSGGRLTEAKLHVVQADLTQISPHDAR